MDQYTEANVRSDKADVWHRTAKGAATDRILLFESAAAAHPSPSCGAEPRLRRGQALLECFVPVQAGLKAAADCDSRHSRPPVVTQGSGLWRKCLGEP